MHTPARAQDLATRGFTVTPETLEDKYKDANILTGEKSALPWKFKEDFNFRLIGASPIS